MAAIGSEPFERGEEAEAARERIRQDTGEHDN